MEHPYIYIYIYIYDISSLRVKKAELGGAYVAGKREGKCIEGLGRKTKKLAAWIT